MAWKVVVGGELERWPASDIYAHLLDPASGKWVDPPDGLIPGYKRTTYVTEAEANAMARRMRAYGYVSATEPAS